VEAEKTGEKSHNDIKKAAEGAPGWWLTERETAKKKKKDKGKKTFLVVCGAIGTGGPLSSLA